MSCGAFLLTSCTTTLTGKYYQRVNHKNNTRFLSNGTDEKIKLFTQPSPKLSGGVQQVHAS
eukprot:m.1386817 g.1386817  ORF g.1386817 m.1386817 type:complete len:61 (-) comp24977_c0_seq6:4976-5158(-)